MGASVSVQQTNDKITLKDTHQNPPYLSQDRRSLLSPRQPNDQTNMVKVAFIHPDLGIGGAERLVCDSALALKSSGHTVKIFTSHHDPSHCFAETRDGSLDVEAVGDFLPRQVLCSA